MTHDEVVARLRDKADAGRLDEFLAWVAAEIEGDETDDERLLSATVDLLTAPDSALWAPLRELGGADAVAELERTVNR